MIEEEPNKEKSSQNLFDFQKGNGQLFRNSIKNKFSMRNNFKSWLG